MTRNTFPSNVSGTIGIFQCRSVQQYFVPSYSKALLFQPRRSSPRGHSHSSIDDSARRMSIHDSQHDVATENSRSYIAVRGSVANDAHSGYGYQSGHYEYTRQQEPPQHHRSVQVTNLVCHFHPWFHG